MAIDPATGQLVGTMIELFVQGAYTVVFIDHAKILYRRRSPTWSYAYFVFTSCILYFFAMFHACIDFSVMITAFTTTTDVPHGALQYFIQWDSPLSRLRTGLYDSMTLLSDLFFVYRVWIVYNCNYWIALLPFLLFVGDIGMTAYVMWSLIHTPPNPAFKGTQIAQTSKYFFSVTLAETMLCTILIAYKIYTVDREIHRVNTQSSTGYRQLSMVSRIIIESAAIYSAIVVVMIVTDVIGSSALFIGLNVTPAVIGLVFSSIIVRSAADPRGKRNTAQSTSLQFTTPTVQGTETGMTSDCVTADGVQIHLSTVSHNDSYGQVKDDKYRQSPV